VSTQDRVSSALPAGVEFRLAQPDDRALLESYIQGLPYETRVLRFFSPQPPRSYLDGWLGLAEEGGACLLVVRRDDEEREVCVGEAGFVPRGDGTAEFALSLDAEVRGGLGAMLLDRLRALAHDQGVRALYADVLTENGAMNRLLNRRGRITVERDGDHTVGVVISTSTGVPVWPDRDGRRARVLVESSGGQWQDEEVLRAAGLQVAVCPGPRERPAEDPCPVLVGERCGLVDEADVVVHALSDDDVAHARLANLLEAGPQAAPVLRQPPDSGVDGADAVLDLLDGAPPPEEDATEP